jgi:r-opsin
MENLLLNASVAYRSAGKPPVVWGFPPGASIIDTVPEDMLEMIHPHWKKFPPVNPMWHYLLVSSHFTFPIVVHDSN